MISFISGNINSKKDNNILVINNGIGYKVFCHNRIVSTFQINQFIELFVSSFLIQESYFSLFGFLTEKEQDLFEEIQKKTSLNKKQTMSIIGCDLTDLISAIDCEDTRFFSSIGGIGTTTAQKFIQDMQKSKILQFMTETQTEKPDDPLKEKFHSALGIAINMGFEKKTTSNHLKDIIKKNSNISLEDMMKELLQKLR